MGVGTSLSYTAYESYLQIYHSSSRDQFHAHPCARLYLTDNHAPYPCYG